MASRLAEFIKRKTTKSKNHSTLSKQLGDVDLPVRVKVISGHPSLDKYSITYDTELDLYSCKSVKMCIVNDVVSSNQYLLPLTAKVKITPFYNPEDKIGIALAGYHYRSIQQLYDSNPRPSVVYVVSGYLHEDRQSSMDTDDIYVIKECAMIDDQRVIICEEVNSSEMKIFPTDLKCHLTTKPSKLSFLPSVFFNHHNLFASKVIVSGIDQSILSDDDDVFLTVTQLSPISSYTGVIRSVNQPYDCNRNITVEIYDDIPIEVEIISLDQSATNLLRFESESLQQTDESPVIIINEVKFCYNEIQMMFLNSSNRDTLIHQLSQAPVPAVKQKSTHTSILRNQLSGNLKKQSSLPTPSSFNADDDGDYDYIPLWCKDDTQDIALKNSRRFTIIDTCTPNLYQNELTYHNSFNYVLEENKEFLKCCKPHDIANILGKLGLEKYKELFMTEQICGSLLMELTDDILMNELGITRKLDRIKLLVIIEGKKLITNFI